MLRQKSGRRSQANANRCWRPIAPGHYCRPQDSHEPLRAQLLHRVAFMMILRAAPARSEVFVTCNSAMMSSMVAALLSTGFVIGQHPSERVAFPVPREIHLRNRNLVFLDVAPDVDLGPVEQRLNAHVLARFDRRGELPPELRRLVLVLPLELRVARRKIALPSLASNPRRAGCP